MNLLKLNLTRILLFALLIAMPTMCCAEETNKGASIQLSAVRIEDGGHLSFMLLVLNSSSDPLIVVADDLAKGNLSISVQTRDETTGLLNRTGFGRSAKISSAPAPKPEEITLRPEEILGRVIRVENFDPDPYRTAYEMEVSLTLRYRHVADDSYIKERVRISVMNPYK